MAFRKPLGDGSIDLIELSQKKVIGVFNNNKLVFPRQGRDETFHLGHGTVNIVRAVHEELRFSTPRQIRKVRVVDRRSKADERTDSRIRATGPQSNPAPETESRNKQGSVSKFRSEKIECRADIVLLTLAAIVFSLAHSRSAKIKTQHREAQPIQRFRGLIHHFVVQRATE